jgi:titin
VSVQASYFNLNTDDIGTVQYQRTSYARFNDVFGVEYSGGASNDMLVNSTVADTTGNGVVITGSGTSHVTLANDFIGIDPTGKLAKDAVGTTFGNTGDGLVIEAGAAFNTITRSVISNNGQQGVLITGAHTSSNLLTGDLVGTNASGTGALPNEAHGVLVTEQASCNTIGGTTAAARDVISGNALNGVAFSVQDSMNVVEGDYIGLNAAGTAALANGASGVFFSGSFLDLIGGTTAGARNVISGNSSNGVWITGGTVEVLVWGNYIGTDATGSYAVRNGNGVRIDDGTQVGLIGDSAAGARNVISGNTGAGVIISGGGTTQNLVAGDYIGTDATGAGSLPNGAAGVELMGGTCDNTVGGTTAGARNVISGNSFGVLISDSGTTANLVAGNYIGTDVSGTRAIGNGYDGVVIRSGATSNTIGGTTVAARNVIAGNLGDGVQIDYAGTSGNVVEGDYIGTDVTGSHAVGNGRDGVYLWNGASYNTIGGLAAGAGNLISGNAANGVIIDDASTENAVQTNDIGTDATGTFAVPNGQNGVLIQAGSTANQVMSNVIAGNCGSGVMIAGAGTLDNTVTFDFIGVDGAGTATVPQSGEGFSNDGPGVEIDGATATLVAYCVIGDNMVGVELDSASGCMITDNDIGTDRSGAFNLGNLTYGIVLNATSGNLVEYNTIAFSGRYGILTFSPGQDTVTSNVFIANMEGNELVDG